MVFDTSSFRALYGQVSSNPSGFFTPDEQGRITLEEAMKIFNAIRVLPDMHLEKAAVGGCADRCNLVQHFLKAAHIKTATIMTTDEVFTTSPDGQEFHWDIMHTAPAVWVVGYDEPFILDPAVANEPLLRSEWEIKINHTKHKTILDDMVTAMGSIDNSLLALKNLESAGTKTTAKSDLVLV